MHELPITQSLLDIVAQKAKETGVEKVTGINVVLGSLCGVESSCVQFYFDFLKKEYKLEDASLKFDIRQARLKCRDCGNEFEHNESSWICSQCGGSNLAIASGSECYVESIEVEE